MKQRSGSPAIDRAARRAIDELLESRRLLSSSLGADGLLTVTGTSARDDIDLNLVGSTLQVIANGNLDGSFDNSLVKSILVSVLAGDDNVRVSAQLIQPATLLGGDGKDRLLGGGGRDLLDGGPENDVLDGGKRGDELIGGDGKDTVDYRSRSVAVNVSLDDVANDGAAEGDNVHSDVETIFGGAGDDTLRGNGRSNRLNGFAGNDNIRGSAGNDSIDGGDGRDSIFGNAGNDSMQGGNDDDQFFADAGEDGADLIEGGGGDDIASYAARTAGVNVFLGTPEIGATSEDSLSFVQTLIGGVGNDTLGADAGEVRGGDGNDRIRTTGGTVTLRGEAGDDQLTGGPNTSAPVLMDGGAGDDLLLPTGQGAFDLRGGDGFDIVDFSTQGQFGSIEVSKDDVANDNGGGGDPDNPDFDDNLHTDLEQIIGTDGPDTITGSDGNDVIDGGGGGDQMFALGGNDTFLNATLPDTPDAENAPSDFCDGGAGIDALQDDGDPGPSSEIKFALQSIGTAPAGRAHTHGHTRAPDPPSATLTTTGGKKGELTIVGTASADTIAVLQTAATTTVYINTLAPFEFASSQVKKVVVFAGAGNDLVNLRSSKGTKPVTKTSFIFGQDGNDTLLGGDGTRLSNGDVSGGDLIAGGNGNDSIRGGNGRDYIDGGDQAQFVQSDGTDTLDGGAGNDVVAYYARSTGIVVNLGTGTGAGSPGENDRLLNIEDIYSGLGNDSLLGSDGGNLIDGGNGKDTIRAAGGVDRIKAGKGADSVFTLGDGVTDVIDLVDLTRDVIHADVANGGITDKVARDTQTGAVDELLDA